MYIKYIDTTPEGLIRSKLVKEVLLKETPKEKYQRLVKINKLLAKLAAVFKLDI